MAARLALALLAIVPFLGGVRGGFIGDDVAIIQLDPGLRAGADPLELFGRTWWRDYGAGGLYRPLTTASFYLDRVVWGEDDQGAPDPVGIHASSLLLNAAAALAVFALLRRRARSDAAAWAGAALFAVHPVHTEAVVHLVGRADLLCAVFFLLAWRLHDGASLGARVGAALAFLCALLSKEMAASLPLVLLAEAALVSRRAPPRVFAMEQLRALAPYALVFALFMALRGAVLGASLDPPERWVLAVPDRYLAFQAAPALEVLLTMTHAFGEYLRLLLLPWPLSADYSGFPRAASITPAVLLSAAAWAGVAAAAAWAWRRGERGPARWLVLAVAMLLPVSNLLVGTGVVLAERLLYLPSVAFAGAVAWVAGRWPLDRRVGVGLLAALLVVAALLSAVRSPVWRAPSALYAATVDARHAGHVAWNGYAGVVVAELAKGEDAVLLERGLEAARRATEAFRSVSNTQLYSNLLIRAGRNEESLRQWEAMLAARPDSATARRAVRRHLEAFVNVSLRDGDAAAARRWAERLDAMAPGHALARRVLGDAP